MAAPAASRNRHTHPPVPLLGVHCCTAYGPNCISQREDDISQRRANCRGTSSLNKRGDVQAAAVPRQLVWPGFPAHLATGPTGALTQPPATSETPYEGSGWRRPLDVNPQGTLIYQSRESARTSGTFRATTLHGSHRCRGSSTPRSSTRCRTSGPGTALGALCVLRAVVERYGKRRMPASKPRAPPSTTTTGAGHFTESTRQNAVIPMATVVRGITADALHARTPAHVTHPARWQHHYVHNASRWRARTGRTRPTRGTASPRSAAVEGGHGRVCSEPPEPWWSHGARSNGRHVSHILPRPLPRRSGTDIATEEGRGSGLLGLAAMLNLGSGLLGVAAMLNLQLLDSCSRSWIVHGHCMGRHCSLQQGRL